MMMFSDLLGMAVQTSLIAVHCGVVVGMLLFFVAYSVVAERRFSAWFQDRIGPNRVGLPLGGLKIGAFTIPNWRLLGLGQPMVDGIKFLLKEEITPGHVNKPYYYLAPALAMVPALLTITVVPVSSGFDLRPLGELLAGWFGWGAEMVEKFQLNGAIADLDVGILFAFAIISISVYGIVLAGWASNSKFPFLGGIRSSAQMISYELTMGLAVVPVFLLIGNLNLGEIVRYQAVHGALAFPLSLNMSWEHWLLALPLACSFFLFLISAFAETNRLPFDMPEAENELVGGYHTEYGAMKFALFFLGEYAAMLVASCFIVTLFLGGWSLAFIPYLNGVAPNGLEMPWFMGFAHAGVFILKMAFFMFLFIWVRWTLPRFRYDQLMGLGWKVFLPLALANVLLTAFLIMVLAI
ncbi:MAG: NADH-quinone oxidoreductase subunit H [Candidatus Methylacidiphilales bacterium]